MQTRTLAALATVPVAVILSLAGCAGDDGGSPPSGADATGGSAAPTTLDEQLLAYAQCMRDEGIDVPDPEPGQGIALPSDPENQDAIEAADAACEHLLPAPDADEAEAEHEEMLEYAQCMRDHGVEAMEDPQPGEGIHAGPETAGDPDFEAAEAACEEQLGLDGGNRQEG